MSRLEPVDSRIWKTLTKDEELQKDLLDLLDR